MRFFPLGILALTALTQPVAAQSDWTVVRQLPPGKEVSVETAAGDAIIGKLAAVSDSAVVVRVKGRDRSIPRTDVRRISRRLPPRARRLIMTGVGIGAGAAMALVMTVGLLNKQCGESCDDEKAAIAGVLIGLPTGGGLLGRYLAGKGKWELVYSSAP